MKKIISILLSLALCLGMCPPVALAADVANNVAGSTLDVLNQGDTMFNNYGTIKTNCGTVYNNDATGIIESNSGSIWANYGIVYNNSGNVHENFNSTGASGSGLTPGRVYNIDGGTITGGYYNTGTDYYLIKLADGTSHATLTAELSGLEGDEKQYITNGSTATLTADDGYVIRSATAGGVSGTVQNDGKTCTFTFGTVSEVTAVSAKVETSVGNPVARVVKDGTTTYVGALADAFTDGNSGATVTLLSEVDLGTDCIDISGSSTFTLDLNGRTVKAAHYGAFDISGGSLTIQDSGTGGKIESSDITIEVTGGTLSIQSGTVSGRYGVKIFSGTVNISGGTISGNTTGLWVYGGGSTTLSGGTFSGSVGVQVEGNASVTLKNLLAARYAYHQNDIPVAKAEGWVDNDNIGEVPLDTKPAWLTGTVTVKECSHTGGLTPSENGYQHGGPCKCCGSPLDTANHTLGADNQCGGCGAELVAEVEKSGSDTVYVEASGLNAALADNNNEGAVFTLLKDVTYEEREQRLEIKITCTLDLGGHTIRSKGEYAIALSTYVNTTVTIRGEGTVISERGHGFYVNGTATLEGGTFISGAVGYSGVQVGTGKLIVTSEAVVIENTGGGTGLGVNSGIGATAQLSAGTYSGTARAISVSGSFTLDDLLNQKGTSRVAYYKDNATLVTEGLDGKTLPGGSYTVKACTHTGEGVCTYTHNENASTHTKTCLACGKTWDAEDCDYGEYTHNDTGHTRICKLCEYQNVEAHNIKCTAEASGTVIAVSEACKTCGYGKDLGTVTIHIPKLVYGDLTGVVTAENTLTEPVAVAGNVKNPLGETIIFSDHVIIDPPTMDTLTGNALLSAGEHKIKINIVIIRDENALAECELTFNVDPAPLPEVTLSAESATYSGTEQKPALSVQQGETALTEGTDYEVSYKRGDAATTDFTNAGTVNITVTGKGNYTGSVEKTYTIGKATPTIEWANNSPVELTYTGQSVAIEPTVTLVNDENFSGTITYTYGTYSGPDLPTNVGTYSIKASIAEQDNYLAAQSEEMTLTIKKANVTVTAPAAKTLTYTGEAQALVEAGTANVGDMVYSTAQDGTYTKNIPTGTNTGTYEVWYKVEGTDNYNGTAPAKVDATIEKASHEDVTVETSAKFGASRTYDISGMLPDGAELGNITVSDGIFADPQPAVNGGVLSYTLAADQTNVNKSGTVTVPVTSSTNYNAFNLIIKITVADVDIPELTVDAISVTYTGQPVPNAKISGTAVVNGTPVKGGWSFAPGQALTDVKDSGLKEVIFTPEDSTIYGKAKGYAQVQIGKATPTLRLTASPTATTGGDVTFSLSGLPDGGTANLTCSDKDITVTRNQDGTFTASIPQGGTDTTYTFTAAYAGDSNHEKANTSCSVQRKALTELPDPPADDGSNKFKLVMEEGISEVPAGLKDNANLNTPEKLETVMKTKVMEKTSTIPAANTAVYDVALLVSTDGGGNWTAATKDNFPAGGLTVTLPYPSGTNSSYTFTVVHMFTTTDFGNVIGDIETPTVTNTTNGLRFTVTGLSPISVGWEKKSSGSSGGGGGWVSYYTIKVNDSEHGKVTADRTSIYAGGTVTLTVQPDEGYKLYKITVTDSQNQAVELTEKNGKYTFKMPSRNVTVKADFVPAGSPSPEPTGSPSPSPSGSPTPTTSPSPSPDTWKNPFPDVSDTGWYIKAVEFVCKNGLMAGYENGKFGPNDSMTRAQFAQIIYNKAGRPQAGSGVFSDVTTGWYANAVNWAAAEGIVTGVGGGRFAPDRPITRQDLAVMLWRYAGSPEPRKNELDFSDAGKVSTYAWKALCWANENGIVSGKGNGILDPKGKATRAEAAQMLMNYSKK